MIAQRLLAVLAFAFLGAPDQPLFSSNSTLELTLRAPLQRLFKAAGDDKFSVNGVLT